MKKKMRMKYEEPNEDEYVKITGYYRDGDNVVPITRKIKRQEGITGLS